MKRFFRKRLPAVLLALAMMVSLMPAAMAEEWSGGSPECTHENFTEDVTKPATCSEDGTKTFTCRDCNATRVEVIPATGIHSFSGDWTKDNDETHSRACSTYGCEERQTENHSFTSTGKDATGHWKECVCGARTAVEDHVFSRGSDNASHWMACSCGYKDPASVGAHLDSNADGLCDTCGAQVHTHSFPDTWKTNTTQHWHQCSCGEKISVGNHADSNTDGKCDTCGYIMSSTSTGKNFTITVDASTSTTVGSTIRAKINSYFSGNFSYVTFDTPSGTSYGTLYANSSQKSLSTREYSYSTSGSYPVSNLYFVSTSKAGTYSVSYTATDSNGNMVTGTISITVTGSAAGTTITYNVKAGGEVIFDKSDFQAAYREEYSTGTIKYVTFETSDTLSTSKGTVYYNYELSGEKAFTSSTIEDYDFYYSSSSDGDYALEDLSFVAPSDASTHTVELTYIAYYSNTRYVEGTLVIKISGSTSGSSGNIVYKLEPGKEVAFDKTDFNEFFQDETSSTSTIKYVTFSTTDTLSTSAGTVYFDYDGFDEKAFTKSTIDDFKFYYSSSSNGDYALEDLSFVAPKGASARTVELDFTAYYSSTKKATGTLVIEIGGSGSSDKGDIVYKLEPGKEVAFDKTDFNEFFQDETSSTSTIKYVTFSTTDTLSTSAGTVYYDYDGFDEKAFTKSTIDDFKFYYSSSSNGDYALEDLSFVAPKGASARTVKLDFTAYYSSTKKATGTLVIEVGTAATSATACDVLYQTTSTSKLQLKANDFSRFLRSKYPSSTLQYVKLLGVPGTGGLYYNYYSASKYGTTARLQLTSSNCTGQTFYVSPSSTTQYALSELTYVPSGTNYCAAIPFTAYGTDGAAATGIAIISVTNSTVPEVYGVITKGTSVNFPAPSIAAAAAKSVGTFSGIQLLRLPSTAKGTVYVGTGTTRKADTGTVYGYSSGTWTISQLRFVPAAGYTGNVEIPYAVCDSSGKALGVGKFCLGVVNAQKKFSDVTASTWCYKYVAELSDAKVIDGYSDGTFKPDNKISYGAALKLIMLAAGYPEQKPTNSNPFSGYLAKARADGIITRSNVDLTVPITRLQVAQLAAGSMKLDTSKVSSVKPFTDTTDASVQALNEAGIVEGYFSNGTSTYKPGNTLTRGQVSAIVWRIQQYKK